MKILQDVVRDAKALVFVDLEGTQSTSEVIEIGAVIALLDKDGHIKKKKKPYRTYVKAHAPIGPVVTRLTGIKQKTLNEEGLTFAHAMSDFRKYVGRYWDKALFVTFGTGDRHMINESYRFNKEAPIEIGRDFGKRNWDLCGFLKEFVQDDKGNNLSLTNYLKVFGVPFTGTAHDACADAYNLMILYEAIDQHPEILADEYEKTLLHYHKLPRPFSKIMKRLLNGETVKPEDYRHEIEETFK